MFVISDRRSCLELTFGSPARQDEDGLWEFDPLHYGAAFKQDSRFKIRHFIYPEDNNRQRGFGRHFFNSGAHCQADKNNLLSIDGFSFASPPTPYFSSMQDEMEHSYRQMKVGIF